METDSQIPAQKDVEAFECKTLEEFRNLVSPVGQHFGQPNERFVYRGQRDSTWKLIPTVYRREVIDKYKRGMMAGLADHPGQFFFEWSLLQAFIDFCDSSGLSVPSDSMEFRNYFSQNNITNIHGTSSEAWPQEKAVPIMALAQHHGIPTRLLDWSSNPYVACYFAAESAIKSPRNGGKLALFAFNVNAVHTVPSIKHVRVPGSTSANLSSQGGSFILVGNHGFRGETFTPDVSLESKLVSRSNVLKKVTLPSMLAGDLLLRCHKFGVSAASVFPGYDGVAKAVLEGTLAFNFNLG